MQEQVLDDPTLPPPGRRSGAGAASILPYLLNSLAARPQTSEVDSLRREARAGESPRPDRRAQ